MTDTTELTREEVEALLAGATPGPWQVLEDGRSRVTLMHVETAEGCPAGIGLPVTSIPRKREPDADLIAAAPTLARQLLATMDELAEARATLAALRGVVLDTQAAYGGGSLHEWTSCPFCGADGGWDDTMEGILHDAGCPWKHERDRKADAALATTEPPDAD